MPNFGPLILHITCVETSFYKIWTQVRYKVGAQYLKAASVSKLCSKFYLMIETHSTSTATMQLKTTHQLAATCNITSTCRTSGHNFASNHNIACSIATHKIGKSQVTICCTTCCSIHCSQMISCCYFQSSRKNRSK